MKYGIGGAVVVAVAALAFVAAKKNTTKPVEVRTEAVEARDLVASVTASGQIQPRTMVNVSADVTGKIVRLSVKEGDIVKKGQFLLQIDPEQPTAALQRSEAGQASAKAQAAQARANLIQAERNYERSLKIQQSTPTLVSVEQIEQLKTQMEVNKALAEAADYSVEQAVASVRDARQALNRTTIVAPMSGKITRLNVEEGETAIMGTLNKDAATLLTISDMAVLETKVKVDETDVARINVGDSALIQIDAFPDTTFVGKVVEISNSSVTKTATANTGDQAIDYEVRVQLLNPPVDTRPDFSATAKIVTATRTKVLSIPIIALTVRENESLPSGDSAMAVGGRQPTKEVGKRDVEGVFIVGADNKVTFRPVKVGIAGERHFEVLDGLKTGETIVAGTYQAIRELKDGALIKVNKPEEKKAPAAGSKS
ncbi:secretion protein HlyD family protein [Gemmatimonas aurantiaca T-27]|uniref:Secretion protein HlyD family protein n=1 Tax=Gemmatimonas aurantiaca (strain DSM 14586 / JCM 11422 / NBRC 100505 / T-27) TaxID=379066 RepID=C1A7H9_GEMAT|nr:secretion protein HlyD family protein [Gemmatimonas aurantiaca T-27]